MAFTKARGLVGLVFEPPHSGAPRKHPCPDCFACQFCSDDRCRVCRRMKRCRRAAGAGGSRTRRCKSR